MGVARDNYPRDGSRAVVRRRLRRSRSRRRDRRTSQILDFAAVADVGTVHQPAQPAGPDLRRRRCSASATRIGQKWVYDQHYGVPLAKRFHYNKPPTILDAPAQDEVGGAVNLPDPETPVGARGIGEPPVGAGLRRGAERDLRRRSATTCSGARR